MKRLAAAVLVIIAVGCERPESDRVALTVGERPADSQGWLVDAVQTAHVRQGVIAQHTLYPYQFVVDGAALNELGERDVAILAEHYSAFPGPLNVRRGDASEDLHSQRVDAVVQALAQRGVDTDRIQVQDAAAAGGGSPSEHVLLVMKPKKNNSRAGCGISLLGLTTETQQ